MAFLKINDGVNYINKYDSQTNTISQYWRDQLGQSTVNDFYGVSTQMKNVTTTLIVINSKLKSEFNKFSQECGLPSSSSPSQPDASSPSAMNYDNILRELEIIKNLFSSLFISNDSDSSGNGSHFSMGMDGESQETSGNEWEYNLDGTMLQSPAGTFYQEYADAYTEEHVKTKIR